jgi:F-type H+-transporting ATPase subunit b
MKKTLTILISIVCVVLASVASASSGGGHGAEEYTFMGDWLPRLINFAIIVGALVFFLRKPVRDMFKNRTAEIAKAMEESKEVRERALAALAEMERKAREMDAETLAMVADARVRGEKDKQALIEEGRKIVLDIQAQVKIGADIEVQKAKADLAIEAARLAVDLAEGKIKDKITSQDHERIVKDYISSVGGRG